MALFGIQRKDAIQRSMSHYLVYQTLLDYRPCMNCTWQASIARGVEEKISGQQRRYLLEEQLKAIKKVGHCSLLAF